VERVRRSLVLAALLVLAAGAFQPFYLTVWRQNRAAMLAHLIELPHRKVPGLRQACEEAARRTPVGARILLVTRHPSWAAGYEYAFRRAQYLVAGREVVPMLASQPPDQGTPPTHVLCVPRCNVKPGFRVLWEGTAGVLLESPR
jgi:hypothetical protein